MYLSRIKLDVTNRNTLRALNAPSKFHGALESSLSGDRKRNLWRIDCLNGHHYLLLLSEDRPELSVFCSQFCQTAADCETKSYDGLLRRIQNDSQWRFRLTANPTKSRRIQEGEMRGKILAHITTDYQKEWLMEQSAKRGFLLTAESFDVIQSKWYRFYKADKNTVSLLSVTYEGVLRITDETLFQHTLIAGIGRGKAYGMGLLTIMQG